MFGTFAAGYGLVLLAVVGTARAVDECASYAGITRLPRIVVPTLMNISLTVRYL